jgi:hypothetical protein
MDAYQAQDAKKGLVDSQGGEILEGRWTIFRQPFGQPWSFLAAADW